MNPVNLTEMIYINRKFYLANIKYIVPLFYQRPIFQILWSQPWIWKAHYRELFRNAANPLNGNDNSTDLLGNFMAGNIF